ncbi:MAG: O-antigen ligase family protein [Verrucomicrobia bacterium]|nr:O-antigen ligase family protein [Verrucomicrobiota bacterium]
MQKKLLKMLVLSAPFFLYCLGSAIFLTEKQDGFEPIFRFFLMYFQALFVFGAASSLSTYEEGASLLNIYIKSYLLSLAIGYILYIGFFTHLWPLDVLEFFSVLTQSAYGFLRFSPGSYPNEYGIVSSFVLSVITWLLFTHRGPKTTLILLYSVVFVALLLTTTRTAFVTYFCVLCFMAWKNRSILKTAAFLSLFVTVTFAFLQLFHIDIAAVFAIGFTLDNLESGTLFDRLSHWSRSFSSFKEQPFLGGGFSSEINLHNLYLQLLFELGVGGILALVLGFILSLWEKGYVAFKCTSKEDPLLLMVTISGLIHVLLFAATNHNLNHHLTWLIVFYGLFLRKIRRQSLPA